MKFVTSALLVTCSLVCASYTSVLAATVPFIPATSAMPWIDAIPSAGGYTFNGMGRIVPNDLEAFKLLHGADGSIAATASTKLPATAASTVVDVTAKIPKAQVLGAIGRFIGKAMPLLNTLSALAVLAAELKVIASNKDGESPKFTETLDNALGDCQTTFANVLASNSRYYVRADSSGYCFVEEKLSYPVGAWDNVTSGWPVRTTGTTSRDITPDQFMEKLRQRQLFDESSALTPVFKEAVKANGEIIQSPGVTVKGPASVETGKSSSVSTQPGTPATGTSPATPSTTTTTVTTTTNNYTYQGPNVSVTNTTSSTTYNRNGDVVSTTNPLGDPTGTTTTTSDKNPQLDEQASDTALPAQPVLYKKKYPNGITGVWQTQRDLMANLPLFTIAKTLMPAVGLGGSCPMMPVNLNFSQWANFGTKDVAPPCIVWDWGKAICIVSACLLARRLIFGG